MKSIRIPREEHLTLVLQNGADLSRRRIYLCGDINDESAYRFVVALQTMDEDDGPITLVMNTPGGICEEGFAIYDAIRFANNQVYVIGFGQVASMGSIILQAGARRMLSAECDFMIHDVGVSAVASMSLREVQTLNHNLQRLQRRANRILTVGSSQTEEQVVKWCAEETTFTAEQAVKAGFADAVLTRNKTRKRKVTK